VELLGGKAVPTIDRALDGTGRGRAYLDSAIDSAICKLPKRDADVWRIRLPRLGGSKGVPTFTACAHAVLDAINDGAVAVYAAEQKYAELRAASFSVPSRGAGEELVAYRLRLDTWALDVPDDVLMRIKFNAYDIVRTIEQCEAEELRNAKERAQKDAYAAFLRNGDYDAFTSATGGCVTIDQCMYSCDSLAAGSPYAWGLVAKGKILPNAVPSAPTADWLDAMSDMGALIACLANAHSQWTEIDWRPQFCARIRKMMGVPDGSVGLVSHKGKVWAVAATEFRIVHRFDFGRERHEMDDRPWSGPVLPIIGTAVPTDPSPSGWVSIGKAWTYYGPESYYALMIARSTSRGVGVDIRSWMPYFSRHPERGFGRFSFGAVAGAAHRDYVMIAVDDAVRDRIESVSHLPDPLDAEFPVSGYCVPMRVRKTDRGGHASWDGYAPHAVAYVRTSSGRQCSRRYIGGTVRHSDASTALAWTASSASAKHDSAIVAAVIGVGQRLKLSTGMGVDFDGSAAVEVPGGGE